MSTKARAGAFLLGGIVLFALGLFLIGSRQKVFSRGFDVYADFSTVGGLVTGADVRVSGLQSGELEEIQTPSKPSGEYRLKMRLDEKIHPLIREDSMASIQTDGLVGDKFLEIDKGSDDSPVCPAKCTVPSTEPFDLSDLVQNSHQLLDTTSSTLEKAGEVADNVNQVLGSFLARGNNGKNGPAELNDAVASTKRAMSNLADDSEALKHNFLFRGFFHSRGYFDLKGLTPDQYRTSKFVKSKEAKRVWLPSEELFAPAGKGQSGTDQQLSQKGRQDLDRAMDGFVNYLPNRPIVVEGYASQGPPDQEYRVSEQHAMLVERYLEERYRLDPDLVGGIPLGAKPPQASGKSSWDGISLVMLP